jgi:HSP20 family protein
MNLVRFNNPRFNYPVNMMDEVFNSFFNNDYAPKCDAMPATNVFEKEDGFKLEVLLPGFNKEDLQLSVNNSVLTIKVEKEEKKEEPKKEFKYFRREFETMNFEKQYRLPKSVDAEKIIAKFENGILNIEIPKKEKEEEKKPLEIAIS